MSDKAALALRVVARSTAPGTIETMKRLPKPTDVQSYQDDELSLRPGEIESHGLPPFAHLRIPIYSRETIKGIVAEMKDLTKRLEALSKMCNERELRVVSRLYHAVWHASKNMESLAPKGTRTVRKTPGWSELNRVGSE